MTKTKKIWISAVIFVLIVTVGFLFFYTSTIGARQTQLNIRNVELNSVELDYSSIINEFENASVTKEGSLTTFEGYQTLDARLFEELDNVSASDVADAVGCEVKYNFSYDSETNIVTLSAKMVNGDSFEIEEIFGAAFINEQGAIDAVMDLDGDYVLLSEMQDAGMIQNCGWFSNLFKKIVKVAVAVVAVAVVCVATAGAGVAACIAIGAAVGAAESVATQLVETGSVNPSTLLLDTALGAIPGGVAGKAIAKNTVKTATASAIKTSASKAVSSTSNAIRKISSQMASNLSKTALAKLEKIGLKFKNGVIQNKTKVVNGETQFLNDSGKVIAQTNTFKNTANEEMVYLMQKVDQSTVKVVGKVPEKGLQKAVGRFDNNGKLLENWDSNLSYERSKAVSEAWKAEVAMVKKNIANGKTDFIGTRGWTQKEQIELLKTGKVQGYEGHHINSVMYSPELAGKQQNIKFVQAGNKEHFNVEHGGNTQNPTFGELINR